MGVERQSVQEVALAHLEEKYGEPFEYVEPWGSSYANGGVREMFVKPASSDARVLASVERTDDGYLVCDNYLAWKYKDEIQQKVADAANAVFGECTVFYEVAPRVLSPGLPADASFEEYSADPEAIVIADVVIPERAFDSGLVQQFADSFSTADTVALLDLTCVNDGDYASLSSGSLAKIMDDGGYAYYAVVIINRDGIQINPREVG